MSYKYIKGWFVNTETKVAVKEPAFIIDVVDWSLLYYGEFKNLEKLFNELSLENDLTLLKFDLTKFSTNEVETILNDFAFNKKFIKFQLMRLVRNLSTKEVKPMALETKNIPESRCDQCGETADLIIANADPCYVCYACETVLCGNCYDEITGKDDDGGEDGIHICPNCGERMYEFTEDDLDVPSFEDLFD